MPSQNNWELTNGMVRVDAHLAIDCSGVCIPGQAYSPELGAFVPYRTNPKGETLISSCPTTELPDTFDPNNGATLIQLLQFVATAMIGGTKIPALIELLDQASVRCPNGAICYDFSHVDFPSQIDEWIVNGENVLPSTGLEPEDCASLYSTMKSMYPGAGFIIEGCKITQTILNGVTFGDIKTSAECGCDTVKPDPVVSFVLGVAEQKSVVPPRLHKACSETITAESDKPLELPAGITKFYWLACYKKLTAAEIADGCTNEWTINGEDFSGPSKNFQDDKDRCEVPPGDCFVPIVIDVPEKSKAEITVRFTKPTDKSTTADASSSSGTLES